MNPWRSTTRDAYFTALQAFQAANSTLCDRAYRTRPTALAEKKSVFIGGISEDIALDSGTQRRVISVDLVAAVTLADNDETVDMLDDLADALIEYFAANAQAHVLSEDTVQQPVRSQSVELDEGGAIIPAVAITCSASIQEGRG